MTVRLYVCMLLFAIQLMHSTPAKAEGVGLLLLKVDGAQTANHGRVVSSGWQPRSYTLMNLETKKIYTNFSTESVGGRGRRRHLLPLRGPFRRQRSV